MGRVLALTELTRTHTCARANSRAYDDEVVDNDRYFDAQLLSVLQRNGCCRMDQPAGACLRNFTTDEAMPFQHADRSHVPVTLLDSLYVDTKTGRGVPEMTSGMAASADLPVTECCVFMLGRSVLALLAKNKIDLGETDTSRSYASQSV